MILDKIAEATKIRVTEDKKKISEYKMREMAEETAKNSSKDFTFEAALKREPINFICEVKKASPSKGIIAEVFPYLTIAREYEVAGAACISVLTEPNFFLGSDTYLREISETVNIPTLRKDFTIDPYQIFQAKTLKASAVLLICALLSKEQLKEYLAIAHSVGLSAIVEAHDEAEIENALYAGSRIIGVNNRNLKNFEVDIQNSVRLRKMVPEEVLFIAESGIKTKDDIRILRDNKVNGVLIGETLMKSDDKKKMLEELKSRL